MACVTRSASGVVAYGMWHSHPFSVGCCGIWHAPWSPVQRRVLWHMACVTRSASGVVAYAMVTRSASGVADDVLLLTKLIAVTEGRSKNSKK